MLSSLSSASGLKKRQTGALPLMILDTFRRIWSFVIILSLIALAAEIKVYKLLKYTLEH